MASDMNSTHVPQEPSYITDIKVYHNGLPGNFRVESDSLDVRLKATVDSRGKISDIEFKHRNGEQIRNGIFTDRRGSLYFTGDARLAQIVIVVMGIACEAVRVPERVSIMVSPELDG
ncbi:hypothetical protein FVEN_g4580 [Fusarium venenatum]|uniref:Uncharacterized protein n=1 Tax=Fusarium venenatum TaxID=56646 RepID=A0A2L2T8B7_9HYPO|nr:uncharacterized protein FVRRES_02521 [Fusarium venenatum]KAG8357953.1 hypothetical protein FVEN_g4580 [Fusarium venenatum]CEI66009.1 unnamed protein product [Fusarium venenatum]